MVPTVYSACRSSVILLSPRVIRSNDATYAERIELNYVVNSEGSSVSKRGWKMLSIQPSQVSILQSKLECISHSYTSAYNTSI
jgi:hypothetical protein